MKFQGSLACLLLALYLGSGEAGPLLGGGASAGTGFGEAAGQAVGDAIGHGIREAIGQGAGEAAHALGNTGSEAGTQTENVIRHGIDAAHSSWQGMPGSNSAWGTNGQPPSGGHGTFGSQGGLRAQSQGNPWIHGVSGGSGGSFGTNSQGSSWGQGGNGGPYNVGTNAQGAVAQPGYGSVRGNGNPNTECTNSPPSSSGGSSSNSWGSSGGSSDSGGGSNSGSSGGSNSGSSGGSNSGSSGGSGGSGGGSGSSGGSSGSNSGSNSGSSSGGGRGSGGSSGSDGSSGGSSGSSGSGGNWEHSGSSSSGSSGGSGGGNKPGCDNPGNDVRVPGSGAQEISREGSRLVGNSQGNYQGQGSSGGGEAVGGIDNLNSQTSPGLFNFDTFWKNFKSKLGFINWDAINKGQVPSPSTRALLYFSRLWEDFKHNTPFLNWKAIIEDDYSSSSLQKRAGNAGQPGAGWPEVAAVTSKNYNYNQQAYPTVSGGQYSAKGPAKGGVTLSSSASRARPGLLQWVKF
ncbi:dermokine isoform X2 [Eptesicus fuscus]|nr:dermokine isoform X2 [Eptesicus fuscus]